GLGFLVAGPPIRTAVRLGSLGPTLARRVRLVRLRGIGWLVALRGGLPRRGRDQRFLVHVDNRVVGPSRRVFGPYRLHPVDPLAGAFAVALPFAVAAHGPAFAFQGRAVAELGVEQDLQ